MQKESDKWVEKYGLVKTGTAAWTGPGKMQNVKYIIHAVGPIWSNVNSTFILIVCRLGLVKKTVNSSTTVLRQLWIEQ